MAIVVLFLNDCVPRLTLSKRFHCGVSLICRWGDSYLHQVVSELVQLWMWRLYKRMSVGKSICKLSIEVLHEGNEDC